jgi:hypothetical protein
MKLTEDEQALVQQLVRLAREGTAGQDPERAAAFTIPLGTDGATQPSAGVRAAVVSAVVALGFAARWDGSTLRVSGCLLA